MADRHFSRRGRARSTAATARSRCRPNSPQLPTGNSTPVRTLPSAADPYRELLNELKSMAWRLTAAYCTCVTVQAALEGQAADHDPEFARCLRSGVADSVSRQIERLHALVGRLAGSPPAPPPQ
jgi:hypothetical protein